MTGRIRIVMATLAAGLVLACSRKPAAGCLSPSDSAECFVTDFYTWYTQPKARNGAEANAREAMRLRQQAFSPAVLSALGSDTGEVRLGFDPFLHSQTPCPRYVTGKVENSGNRTRVAIHCVEKYRVPRPAVIAEVFRADSGFQFTNFLYADSLQPPYADVFTSLAELPMKRSTGAGIVGTWRGTSLCVDRQHYPACKDEQALYEIRAVGASRDSVIVKAQKMIDGSAELVSEDTFLHQPDGAWQTEIAAPRGRVRISLRQVGDSLTGGLFDADSSRKARDIALKRVPR